MPKKRRRKLHLAWDIGAILSLFSMVVGGTIYFTRENARIDYLTQQIEDVRQTQNQYNQKIDKIYDILRGR